MNVCDYLGENEIFQVLCQNTADIQTWRVKKFYVLSKLILSYHFFAESVFFLYAWAWYQYQQKYRILLWHTPVSISALSALMKQ